MTNIRTTILIIISVIIFSGCISNSPNQPAEQVSPTYVAPTSTTPPLTQTSQPVDQNKINELQNKIDSMQQQINELQASLNNVGFLKPSKKKLIPNLPFRVEVKFGEMQTPTAWTFKENGQLEIRDGDLEYGTYKLFPNNNTIKLTSKKYDFYGLVLYDDYATAIYDNGWIAWVQKYQIFPPTYNPLTQQYELN